MLILILIGIRTTISCWLPSSGRHCLGSGPSAADSGRNWCWPSLDTPRHWRRSYSFRVSAHSSTMLLYALWCSWAVNGTRRFERRQWRHCTFLWVRRDCQEHWWTCSAKGHAGRINIVLYCCTLVKYLFIILDRFPFGTSSPYNKKRQNTRPSNSRPFPYPQPSPPPPPHAFSQSVRLLAKWRTSHQVPSSRLPGDNARREPRLGRWRNVGLG